jgi:hypothetical protein
MLHEHVPHGSPNLLGHAMRRKLSANQASQWRGVHRVVAGGYRITASGHPDPKLCPEIDIMQLGELSYYRLSTPNRHTHRHGWRYFHLGQ